MYQARRHQLGFSDFYRSQMMLPDHELLQIKKIIDWEGLLDKFEKFYSVKMGRNTKPCFLKIAALILKHLYRLPDRELVRQLRENIYFQEFCDIDESELIVGSEIMDPSLLSHFRDDIGEEGVKMIEDAVTASLKRAGMVKGRKVITDTTCMPVNIRYPLDIELVDKCRKKLVTVIKAARVGGIRCAEKMRHYCRKAKKIVRGFSLSGRKTKEKAEAAVKKVMVITRSNLRNVIRICRAIARRTDREAVKIRRVIKAIVPMTKRILEQTRKRFAGEKIKNRIVSIHEPRVRPIVRGKVRTPVEFGPKVALSQMENGFIQAALIAHDNVDDSRVVKPTLSEHDRHFGDAKICSYTADCGMHSPDNRLLLKKRGVKRIAIVSSRRAPPEEEKSGWFKRLQNKRSAIEASISLGKRKYGWDRILYRGEEGHRQWVRLSVTAMNLVTGARWLSRHRFKTQIAGVLA